MRPDDAADRLHRRDDGQAVLTISTWLWGDKYPPEHVERLHASLRRNLKKPFRFLCVTDRKAPFSTGIEVTPIPDLDLTKVKGCFARLRMFDPAWQHKVGVTDYLACVDLDVVITRNCDDVFERTEDFLILQGANSTNPCPYNGSLMMLRKGAHPEVWRDFSLDAASIIPFFSFPDDQGWIAHKIEKAAGWKAGGPEGVYAFQKPGWPQGYDLPANAKMVVFPGWRSPEKFKHLPWIKEHWRWKLQSILHPAFCCLFGQAIG